MLATTMGAVVGAVMLYGLGVWLGAARLRTLFQRYGRWMGVSQRDFVRALEWFDRHDRAVVFSARLLPSLRSLISVPAGVAWMPMGRFLLFTALGMLVWNVALGSLGFCWHITANKYQFVERSEHLPWLILVSCGGQ